MKQFILIALEGTM